jgi:hypothetical protein
MSFRSKGLRGKGNAWWLTPSGRLTPIMMQLTLINLLGFPLGIFRDMQEHASQIGWFKRRV